MSEDQVEAVGRRELSELAHEVDSHVGARIRIRRQERGVTQQELAAAIGISYQQVQKYENGTNRVSAGRLYLLAETLDTGLGYFFEGIGAAPSTQKPKVLAEDAVQVARELGSLRDPRVRKSLRALVHVLSRGEDAGEDA